MQRKSKSSVAARVLTPLLAWAGVSAALAGCGQKGPLNLPPPATSSAASAPGPAPAR